MKLRLCFISNSSSSSYVILKRNLSEKQIDMIYNHIEYVQKLAAEERNHSRIISENDPYGEENWDDKEYHSRLMDEAAYATPQDKWDVTDRGNDLFVATGMDNFSMRWFLRDIVGVDDDDIEWEDF